MEDFFQMLGIKHIKSTFFHPQNNGIIEIFHYSLKKSLKRLCVERVKDWPAFIGPCLFAQREAIHESTGFAPFEVVFGKSVKGGAQILRQLLTNETLEPEVKTTYQHVLDLRSRIQETCKIVKEELGKSQARSKIQFDKRTKHRTFKVGDLVLLLLSAKSNCLEYYFSGPFKITRVVGIYDYEIEMSNGKKKVFHINMLKKYVQREPEYSESDVSSLTSQVTPISHKRHSQRD